VHLTDQRSFVDTLGTFAINETSLSGFGESTWQPVMGLRLVGGLRGDWYDFNVEARDAVGYDGSDTDAMVSPRFLAAWQLNDTIELYANWGRGFHSNDARGVVNPVDPVPGLVRGTGKEIGARYQLDEFQFTATYWWLDLDSELKFIGDSNSVEPSEASKRHGLELVAFWRPYEWLALDASYTISNARYLNSPGAHYVPGAFESAGQIGVALVQDEWEAAVRLRHLGPYPLIEDNSVRDDGSTIVNLRAAWKPGAWEIYGEVLNLFDSRAKDIAYYYESYLPAINVAPTEGRVSRVVEPITFRVGARYNF